MASKPQEIGTSSSPNRRPLRDQVLAMSDQILVSATGYLTTVLVGRVSKEELGIYGLGVPLVLALVSGVESLLGSTLVSLGHRLGDRRRFLGSSLVGLAVVVAVSSLAIIAYALLGSQWFSLSAHQSKVMITVALVTPFYLLRLLLRRAYFASLNVGKAILLDGISCVLLVGMLVTMFAIHQLGGIAGHLIVGLANAMVIVPWLILNRHEFQINLSWTMIHLRECWNFARSAFISQVLWVLHISVVLWSIPFYFGAAEGELLVADFLACLSTILFANPFVLGVLNLLGPRAARGFENGGHPEVRRVVWRTSVLMAGVITLLWLSLVLGGDLLLGIVFGQHYRGQSMVISILGLSMISETICKGPEQGLLAIEKPGVVSWTNLFRLLITLACIAAFVPEYGLLGAAMSLAIADCCAAITFIGIFVRCTKPTLTRVSSMHTTGAST